MLHLGFYDGCHRNFASLVIESYGFFGGILVKVLRVRGQRSKSAMLVYLALREESWLG